MESNLRNLESRADRRERELRATVDDVKATAKLEYARLQAIHSQECREKDEELVRFQRDLELLVRSLRKWQDTAMNNNNNRTNNNDNFNLIHTNSSGNVNDNNTANNGNYGNNNNVNDSRPYYNDKNNNENNNRNSNSFLASGVNNFHEISGGANFNQSSNKWNLNSNENRNKFMRS